MFLFKIKTCTNKSRNTHENEKQTPKTTNFPAVENIRAGVGNTPTAVENTSEVVENTSPAVENTLAGFPPAFFFSFPSFDKNDKHIDIF